MATIASSNRSAELDAGGATPSDAEGQAGAAGAAAADRVAQPRMLFDREVQAARRYWGAKLDSISFEPFIPLDRPRPLDGARTAETLELVLDAGLHNRLRRLTSANALLLFSVLTLVLRLCGARVRGRDLVTLFVPTTGEGAVDLLPIAEALDQSTSVREALLASREVLASALRHQRFGLSQLRSLFDSAAAASRPSLIVAMTELHPEPATFEGDINLLFSPAEATCGVTIRFDRRVYNPETISGFFASFQHLLTAAIASMEQPLQSLSAAVALPATPPPEPVEPIQDIIAATARAAPERVAVVERDVETRYGELVASVDRLTATLAAMQLDPARPIAMLVEGGLEAIVAMLASWKLGHAIVPIDPGAVDGPTVDVLESLGCCCCIWGHMLGQRDDVPGGSGSFAGVVLAPTLDTAPTVRAASAEARSTHAPIAPAHAADTAIVLPADRQDGIRHADLAGVFAWINRLRGIGAGDTSLVWPTMPLFDRLYGTLGVLMAGGKVVFAEPASPEDAHARARQFALHAPSLWLLRWPLLDELLRALPANARGPAHVLVTGEAPQGALARRALRRFPQATLDGLWQAGVDEPWSVHFAFSEQQANAACVGSSIAGFEHRVAHPGGGDLPLATAGALEARRVGAPAWRDTGVRAQMLPGGQLLWLGGRDRAVSRRGCQMPFSRIEAELGSIAAVRFAQVVAEAGPGADARLVAFVSVDEGTDQSIPDQAVRQGTFDAGIDRLVVVEHWPLDPAGDIDRSALRTQTGYVADAAEAVPGNEAIRARLRPLWLQTLQVEAVDDDESFFGSGGNSLKATLLITRIKETFGIPLSVQEFFRKPTISAIAELIGGRQGKEPGSDGSELKPVSRERGRVLRSEVEKQIQTA